MKPGEIDTAIVDALQGGAMAKAALVAAVGCAACDLDDAIRRLRYQGKMHWAKIELSPSMIEEKGRPEEPDVCGAGVQGKPVAALAYDAAATDEESCGGADTTPPQPTFHPLSKLTLAAPPGIIRTRDPAGVLRRIAAQMGLDDGRGAPRWMR